MSMLRERALKKAKRERAVRCIRDLIENGLYDHRSDVSARLGAATIDELRNALELLEGLNP